MSKIIKKKEYEDALKPVSIFFSDERFIESQAEHAKQRAFAEKIKRDATEEAERILSAAKEEADAERKRAFKEGVTQGLAQVAPLEGMLESLLREVKTFKEEYPLQLEPELIQLVLQICRKVIKDRLETDRDFIIRTVKATFKELTDREYIKIRVNAGDYEALTTYRPQLLETFHEIRQLEIVSDDGVDKGGCIVETNEGSIDATLRTQLKKLEGVLVCENVSSHSAMRS